MKIKMMIMMAREEEEERDNIVCCPLVDSFIRLAMSKMAAMTELIC